MLLTSPSMEAAAADGRGLMPCDGQRNTSPGRITGGQQLSRPPLYGRNEVRRRNDSQPMLSARTPAR